MIRVHQVKCANENEIEAHLLKKLRIANKDLFSWKIHRKSVDARKQKVLFSYVIDCKVRNEKKCLKDKDVTITPDETYHNPKPGNKALVGRPVVVGFGPAGMFAALLLARNGYNPIIIERGSCVEKRTEDVENFWKTCKLNEESNVQFGEGGAGTFSDGKLTTRSKDVRCAKVLKEFVHFGAKEDILIDAHPHIGTDAFVEILKELRKEIIALGGTFYFDTKLETIEVENNTLQAIVVNGKRIECNAMILGIGHSATDTILSLHEQGLHMENKPFAIGVRIEHTQEFINQAMLKEYCQDERLIPARYQLTYTASNKKGVYTFCMCPGGYVVNSSSKHNQLVVNGMSYASRSGINANSALLVQVNEEDYGKHLFDGLKYQEQIEKKAYDMAKGFHGACQLAKDYLDGKVSNGFENVLPTIETGTTFVDLNTLFDKEINLALHEALNYYENKVPGFVKEGAILTAVESRSSSSIRILRNAECMSNIEGIYPSGEGSGYAGGIMTSAIDGLKCAEYLIQTFDKPTMS